jgi:hypothetical protein
LVLSAAFAVHFVSFGGQKLREFKDIVESLEDFERNGIFVHDFQLLLSDQQAKEHFDVLGEDSGS